MLASTSAVMQTHILSMKRAGWAAFRTSGPVAEAMPFPEMVTSPKPEIQIQPSNTGFKYHTTTDVSVRPQSAPRV